MTRQTPDPLISGLIVAILADTGFEQEELTGPRDALEELGATTRLISVRTGQIQGFHHDKPADKFDVALTFEQAQADAFDAVLLPGGVMNADMLRMSLHARQFVKDIDRAGKPVAVICHGAWLLVSAGLVKGRKLTSWPSLQDDIRNAGGEWRDEQVVQDRNWISSRKPADIPAFNARFADVLRSRGRAGGATQADMGSSSAGEGG